jgi:hypothetical protein
MGGHPSYFIASVMTRMRRLSFLRPRKGICQVDSLRSHGKVVGATFPLIVTIDAFSFQLTKKMFSMLRTAIMSCGIRRIMGRGLE